MTSAIGLDLGTTAIKAGLLSCDGAIENLVSIPAPQIATAGQHSESDALAYAGAAERALAACNPDRLALPLGLSCQRSSFLLWEQASGRPVTPMISWQDTRGAASCKALSVQGEFIRESAGLPLTPYYFAPKLRQLLLDNPDWLSRLECGEWRAGTLDAFLVARWSDGRESCTDASMAARTLLMDIRTRQWSATLCGLFGIPMQCLPRIVPSENIGLRLDNGHTLQASLADQSAAILATLDANGADALVNLGTGGFVVRRLPQGACPPYGYLQTLIHQDRAHQARFALEGTLNSITAALAPYPVHECSTADLGADADIYCLAEPGGLGAPYFRPDIGVHFSQSVTHLPHHRIAVLLQEGIIFRVVRILEDFHRSSPLESVYLSGGLSELACLRHGVAACAPFAVHRLHQHESSLLGAALLATGMQPAAQCSTERVQVPGNRVLAGKYERWKIWLDGLLAQPAPT